MGLPIPPEMTADSLVIPIAWGNFYLEEISSLKKFRQMFYN
jgi:hypothetical protein